MSLTTDDDVPHLMWLWPTPLLFLSLAPRINQIVSLSDIIKRKFKKKCQLKFTFQNLHIYSKFLEHNYNNYISSFLIYYLKRQPQIKYIFIFGPGPLLLVYIYVFIIDIILLSYSFSFSSFTNNLVFSFFTLGSNSCIEAHLNLLLPLLDARDLNIQVAQ